MPSSHCSVRNSISHLLLRLTGSSMSRTAQQHHAGKHTSQRHWRGDMHQGSTEAGMRVCEVPRAVQEQRQQQWWLLFMQQPAHQADGGPRQQRAQKEPEMQQQCRQSLHGVEQADVPVSLHTPAWQCHHSGILAIPFSSSVALVRRD